MDLAKIVLFLTLIPSVAYAEDDWMVYLTNALKTLSNFSAMALPQQIMFLIVLVAVVLILITMAILNIAKFFKAEDVRREEAYRETLKIRKEQEANLQRQQQEASQAFLTNIDAAYKQDFEYYTSKISLGKYVDIWPKIPETYWAEISQFVYREDLKPEEKSARIILIVRRKII